MTMRFTSRWVLALVCVICLHGAAQSQQQVFDSASVDIGVGADGTVWLIVGDPAPGNVVINNNKLTTQTTGKVGISRREMDGKWTPVAEMPHPGGAGAAWRIAADPSGNAWIVTGTQQIFRYDGSQFKQVAALKPRDIGIGADGTIWTTSEQEGARVSTDMGASWKNNDSGKATNVAVENPGTIAWLVNSAKALYRWNGSTWLRIQNLPNGAGVTDVGVGGNNNVVWVVSNTLIAGTHDFLLYSSTDSGKSWKPYRKGLRVAVAPDGSAFVVDSTGTVSQIKPAGDMIEVGEVPPLVIQTIPLPRCEKGASYQTNTGQWVQSATLQECSYDGPQIVVKP